MNTRSKSLSNESSLGKWFFFVLLFVLNISLVYRLVWGQQSLFAYHDLVAQYDDLKITILELEQENATISREIRLLRQDDGYMEKMIRHRLNYVRDNEVLYLFSERQDP